MRLFPPFPKQQSNLSTPYKKRSSRTHLRLKPAPLPGRGVERGPEPRRVRPVSTLCDRPEHVGQLPRPAALHVAGRGEQQPVQKLRLTG